MTSPLLAVAGATKRFGGVAAVQDVSVEVHESEILGVIGPNGAGKTTLLQLISGLTKPDAGQVWLQGTDVTHLPAYRRAQLGIGRTFQIVKPLAGMTVRENVMTAAMFGRSGKERNMAAARDTADRVLSLVSLDSHAGQAANRLGLAQTKRLELAKALACDPRVLLLDEVMAGLNHAEVGDLMALLRRLNASGLTMIVIEHVMKAIMGISTRVLVLHHGRRIALDTPAAIASDDGVIEAYLGARFARAHAAN